MDQTENIGCPIYRNSVIFLYDIERENKGVIRENGIILARVYTDIAIVLKRV